jgi:hypothetical protein
MMSFTSVAGLNQLLEVLGRSGIEGGSALEAVELLVARMPAFTEFQKILDNPLLARPSS